MAHASLRVLTASLAAAILAVLAVSTGAQSLAEAARRERERRAKPAAMPAKAYTDADLDGRGGSPAATPSPSPSPTQAAIDGEATNEEAKRKRQQAEWRTRFADARRQVFEAEARCWHKVVETVFVSGIPVQQWVNKFEENEDLRNRKRELADLEEEYRRTGLPPGWVRD